MFNKFFLTFLLLFSTFLFLYPSKKENTDLTNYCYSLEKILSKNSVEKSKNLSKKFKPIAKDITFLSINKSKGAFANKIINQYKISKKLFIISVVPNKFYCLAGYWIEMVNPGTFQSIFFEKSKEKLNEYRDIKKEADLFINDINKEYKSIKKGIDDLF